LIRHQWADGSAYVNHVELVRKARGAEVPDSFWTDPLMYQGGSDTFIGPRDPIQLPTTDWGIDMEGEVAIVTGVGFFQSKPSSAFSPVAVTPDELGDAWRDGKLHRPLLVDYNEEPFGKANAGMDMTFDFYALISHAAKSRALGAGTIIGSGTVSNKPNGEPAKPIDQGGVGYSCIAEVRMIETIDKGKPSTGFMQFGDTVRIRIEDDAGLSIFGDIYQRVEKLEKPA